MKFLHRFEEEQSFTDYVNNSYEEPFASVTHINEEESYRVDYNQERPPVDYSKIPLTFEIQSSGYIRLKANNSGFTPSVKYSLDRGQTWTDYAFGTVVTSSRIMVSSGDVVQFKADNPTYSTSASLYVTFSGTTSQFKLSGNIMSLIDSTGFATATTLTSSRNFFQLFYNCTGLTDAGNLVLPATTLTSYCYTGMFRGCKNLTVIPSILPATTLATYCYQYMFSNCTGLVNISYLSLPSTDLQQNCYNVMFSGCTSLLVAPSFTANTVSTNCCSGMFRGCTAMTSAPITLNAPNLASSCYNSMFIKCTSLTTVPVLPAKNLTSGCYSAMFSGCSSLSYIKAMFLTKPTTSNCNNWVNGVAATGTFVKNSAAEWDVVGVYAVPEGWTITYASG